MPQIQGVKGEAVVRLLRTLENAGDGVSSAFANYHSTIITVYILELISPSFPPSFTVLPAR